MAGAGGRGRDLTLPAVITVVILLLAVGPLSVLAARLAPLPSPAPPVGVTPADARAPRAAVRDLPVGLPAGSAPTRPADLGALARLALGDGGARQLDRWLEPEPVLSSAALMDGNTSAYPGTYPEVERLLDDAPQRGATTAAAQLGAQLVVLAGLQGGSLDFLANPHPNAGLLAHALLSRARAVAGCDAEVNLLLLLTADNQPHDDVVRAQGRRAIGACPADPTPGWLLAEFQSQRAVVASAADLPELEANLPVDALQRPQATVAELLARFPGSADVRMAAGDVHLRLGRELSPSQPFTGRDEYERALSAYEQALRLDDGAEALVGRARALMGLGRAGEAVPALAPLRSSAEGQQLGPVARVLLEAHDSARDFAAAAGVAADLVAAGPAAFPRSGSLVPRAPALSLGFATALPFQVVLAPCCGGAGGGALVDLAFLPAHRPAPGLLEDVPSNCASFLRVRDALLAGDAAGASRVLPAEFGSVQPAPAPDCAFVQGELLREVVQVEAGQPVPAERRDDVAETRQNLWRWAGNLDRAAAAVLQWDAQSDHARVLPALRLGEIRFLQGRHDDAAAAFDSALRRSQTGHRINFDLAQAGLDRGAALLAAGRVAEGKDLLSTLAATLDQVEAEFRLGTFGTKDEDVAHHYAVLAYYTRLQLGDAGRRAGQHAAALEDYAAARARLPLERDNATKVFPGVLHNNEALALMAVGRPAEAALAADRALATDPLNPVFLLTAGSAAHQAGDAPAARDLDAGALAQDATSFPAANNLGVALAAEGRNREAATAFRRAVGARSDYATAWFNLGVLDSRRGPLQLLTAQGAFARAISLDAALADRPRELVLDEHSYETGLDLSKPVPAGWGLGQVERRQPIAALGLLAVVSAVLALSSATAGATGSIRNWLEVSARAVGRVRLIGRRRHVAWALAATLVAFGVPVVRENGLGVTAVLAYLTGVVLLVAFAMMARQLAADRVQVRPVQRAWPPGLLVGVVGGVTGIPWAPLPYLRVPARAARIHLVAPVGLGLLACLLLVESTLWPVPLTRAIGLAALVMAASVALPLRPLDGKALTRSGVLVGLAAAAASAALLVLGVL